MPALSESERMERAVACLRLFIRDHKGLNRLLAGEFESNDMELRLAITMALEDWSNTPPQIGRVSLANHPAKHLLLLYAGLIAIRQSGLWHSREHMPSSDGGTSADDHAKASEYSLWAGQLQQEYEQKKQDLKLAQNITRALGNMSAPSEYSLFFVYGEELAF